MYTTIIRTLRWTLLAFAGAAFAGAAQAAAVLSSYQGNVRTGLPGEAMEVVKENQPIPVGSSVVTGDNARAILRFDDGQIVVLDQNTVFKLDAFRYDADSPGKGQVVLNLLKGALRSITGLIARSNHAAFTLRAPQATIGVRGTDFMVALVHDSAYLSVLDGSIFAKNDAGTGDFMSGSLGQIASNRSAPAGILGSYLPSEASTAFANLTSVPGLVAGGPLGGAGGGGTTASQGVSGGAIAAGVLGAIAIGAAAAGAGGGGGGSTTTTTHH